MIRKAIESDIEDIIRIETRSFADPWEGSLFREAVKAKNKHLLVDEEDGAVTGYIVLETVLDEAHITDLAVAEKYRRKGIAGSLVKKALDVSRGLKVKSVFLEVRERNEAARKLYSKFGFREIGKRKAYYQKMNEDALILCLETCD